MPTYALTFSTCCSTTAWASISLPDLRISVCEHIRGKKPCWVISSVLFSAHNGVFLNMSPAINVYTGRLTRKLPLIIFTWSTKCWQWSQNLLTSVPEELKSDWLTTIMPDTRQMLRSFMFSCQTNYITNKTITREVSFHPEVDRRKPLFLWLWVLHISWGQTSTFFLLRLVITCTFLLFQCNWFLLRSSVISKYISIWTIKTPPIMNINWQMRKTTSLMLSTKI